MQSLNAQSLAGLLNVRKGAKIVTLVTDTLVTLTGGKGNALQGRVTKESVVNGMVNWNYQNAVNKQRLKEGTPTNDDDVVEYFVPHERSWGTRIKSSSFVCHQTKKEQEKKVYIELKVTQSLGHRYLIDGVECDPSIITPMLPKKSEGRQGVENEVILRDYHIRNIQYITYGGEMYNVDVTNDDEEALYDSLMGV